MAQFCHLHCHSEYSLLDGMSRIEDMVKRAKELDQPAIALTDHGVMFGAIEFYRAAKKHDVKPIMGVEAYLSPRGMKDRDPQKDRQYFHMLLLAQNQTGYQNLLKLSSLAQLEGFYGKPRVDKETLAAHSEGLIATTGCLAAEIPRLLVDKGDAAAYQQLKWYLDVFGRDRFFLELQGHDIPELRTVNRTLLDWTRKHEIGLVATNDVHYVRKEDASSHDILLCMQTRDILSNPKRMRLTPDGSYYITSHDEMMRLFGDYPDALSNTLRIAEMCEVNLDSKGYHLPQFPVPDGFDAESYLRHLVERGAAERYGDEQAKNDPVLRERIERELGIIHNMGFDNYFLIVWDLCKFAADSDIWWNVRGSGAGAVVAYTLRITNIDPIRYDLLFERFLNPARVSMPDIDIDFPDDLRHEMIEYTVRRYGSEKCAAIITFGTLGARAAVRDVGRALEVPLSEVDRIARMVPNVPGKPVKLDKLLFDDSTAQEWPTEAADIRAEYSENNTSRHLLDTAIKLEGQTRHASTHAAGVVIADKPVWEYAPLHRPTKGDETGPIGQVVQFDMNIVESIGLLKVDFLGLATLSIMRRACQLIEQRHGRPLNLSTIPYERCPEDSERDSDVLKAYELMQAGHTVGVFQVEGAGLRRTLQEMRPDQFEHIIAAISLYRPGPMEYIPSYIRRLHGEEKVEYHHETLVPILKDTYGILIYQEQIQRVASDLAGYSPGEADLMRRAVSKKKAKDIEYHKGLFVEGASKRGINRDVAERIYGDIEFFARYGFNRSHAADYAVLTVQTAYLKAHYPVEYLCALLEIEFDDSAKVPVFLSECRRLGIDVLPPDINASGAKFTIEEKPGAGELAASDSHRWAIRVGMGAIKNVGLGAVEAILAEREANGRFQSLDDFCERVDLRQLNRRVLECMAKVGCFDELVRPVVPDVPRETVLAVLDRMIGVSGQSHAAADVGQLSMFESLASSGMSGARSSVLRPLPNVGQVIPKQRLLDEKELLGLYISEHPLQQVAELVGGSITCFCGEVSIDQVGQSVVVAGLLSGLRVITTKKGDRMAFAKLEDLQGEIEVVLFPRTYEQTRELLVEDNILLVRGKVEARNESMSILADVIQLHDSKPLAPVEEAQWSSFDAPPPPPPFPVSDDPSLLDAMKYQVTLTLTRSEDDSADGARLKRVLEALEQFPGEDRFSLRCRCMNGNTILIDFPERKTSWNAALRDILLGQGVDYDVRDITPDPAKKYRKVREPAAG